MHRLITFAFPFILILFETGLRAVDKVDTSSFIGPTLAAAALANVIPLTKLKRLPIPLSRHPNAVAFPKRDVEFVYALWGLLPLGLLAWLWSCQLSLTDRQVWFGMPKHYWVGFGTYFTSMVLTVIKERI